MCFCISVLHIKCNAYTEFVSVFVVVLWSLRTLQNWRPGSRHKLHIYGLYIQISLNFRGIYLNAFHSSSMLWHGVSDKPLSSAGWLCRPRVLQPGDVHLPAGAEGQMARPHHAPTRKPREQTDHPSLWLLWWGLVCGRCQSVSYWNSCKRLCRKSHFNRELAHFFVCFTDECQTKYGNANAWRYCTKVFDMLTVAAVSIEVLLCFVFICCYLKRCKKIDDPW